MMLRSLVKVILPAPLLGRARLWRQRRKLSQYDVRHVRHRYGEFTLDLCLADGLGQAWYDADDSELAEITFLRRHGLKPGAVCFDLGAHQCVVALMLSKIVGPAGKVVAVEATAHNVEIARRNAELNQADNLEVVHAAAADKPGVIYFNGQLNGQVDDGTGAWGRTEVRAVSLDELAEKYGRPDVLFIDVEGFECKVLDGATQVLSGKPDCFVEVHIGQDLEKFGGSVSKVASYFPSEHFNLFMMTDSDREPIDFDHPSKTTSARFFLLAIGRR